MAVPSLGGGRLTAAEAGAELGVPVEAVHALVEAQLLPTVRGPDGDHFALADIRAFALRNRPDSDSPSSGDRARIGLGNVADLDIGSEDDLDLLIAELDRRSPEMAERVLDVFARAFPEAADWSRVRRGEFLEEARLRFEAILAVAGAGGEVGEEGLDELAAIGHTAALAGTSLPEVLVALRISRDLVVQTALEVAAARGRRWGLALALLLTRALPAMDRLTDSIARGYWSAVLGMQVESAARYEAIVEHATDAVVEVDPEGYLRYANPAFAVMIGRPGQPLLGMPVARLLALADPVLALEELVAPHRIGAWEEVRFRRADGIERILQIRAHERRQGHDLLGYVGVIRDVTGDRELSRQKDDFLALMTDELRNPLTIVLGLGITLDTYAGELPPGRVARMGRAIHHHAERIARVADDLFDVSRLESSTLLLTPRVVEVRHVVDAGLGMLAGTSGVDEVEVLVPAGVTVRADPRRLEQVVAHLVENALLHGESPVRVEVLDGDDRVELVVRDHGSGLPPGAEDVVFSRLHPSSDGPRYRDRAAGLGLSLVRGLVEAMGGRVDYEQADDGGACFIVTLLA